MPNVSRPSRPDQADKPQTADKSLDVQAQLRQLRENLLRKAREGTGLSGESASAGLSKKKLAGRKFAGAQGGARQQSSAKEKSAPQGVKASADPVRRLRNRLRVMRLHRPRSKHRRRAVKNQVPVRAQKRTPISDARSRSAPKARRQANRVPRTRRVSVRRPRKQTRPAHEPHIPRESRAPREPRAPHVAPRTPSPKHFRSPVAARKSRAQSATTRW